MVQNKKIVNMNKLQKIPHIMINNNSKKIYTKNQKTTDKN